MKSALVKLLCFVTFPAEANTLVTTIPLYDYNNQGFPWGSVATGATPNYGQTFVAPVSDPVLTSMSFIIKNNSGPIPYHAYVYGWNGGALTGPALFTSPLLVMNMDAWFQTITIPRLV